MSEADLRTKVLIPLFQAMGYLDVFEYHGGSQEQGKDIVMWLRDPMRGRVNHAVVAKAQRITGQADGKNSASDVTFQIQQAFGSPYQDPRSSEQRHVHHVIVVSSKEIKKEAVTAIVHALAASNREGLVTFIDGDKLWEQLTEFLPRAALGQLQRVSEILEHIDPDYRLTSTLSHGRVQFGFEAKDGRGPVRFSFKLPETDAGLETRAAIERHVRTGAPITIESPMAVTLELPAVLQSIFSSDVQLIEVGPRTSDIVVRLRFEVEPLDGPAQILPGLEFKVLQVGTDEATLSNEHQKLPWSIQLVLSRPDKAFAMTMTLKVSAALPVERALQVARLQNALASGGTTRFVNEDTGLPLMTKVLAPGLFQHVEEKFVAFLEAVKEIQIAVGIVLTIPAGDIDREAVEQVSRIRNAIRLGRRSGSAGSISATISREAAERFLAGAGVREPAEAALLGEEVTSVLGTEIHLGSVLFYIPGVALTEESVLKLRQGLSSTSPADMAIKLEPINPQSTAEQYFLRWLPREEVAAVRQRFPGLAIPES